MIPKVSALDRPFGRPTISIVIPTRDPDPYFERALGSVLAHAPSGGDAQIAVVDDGSVQDVESRIRALDRERRVEFHRFNVPAGLSGNLNRAIGLASGHLVHLLHQDDYVLPGFYARMLRVFERAPMVGMAFCRTLIVDHAGRGMKRSSGPQLWSGIARRWVAKIATRQRVQTPSAVVARNTYEQVGGYREDLKMALDWEMWVRIAVRYPVWFESRTLAAFRRHDRSTTVRLRSAALEWPDVCHAIRLNAKCCRAYGHADAQAVSAHWYARSAMREAARAYSDGAITHAQRTLAQCRDIVALVTEAHLREPLERRLASAEARFGTPNLR